MPTRVQLYVDLTAPQLVWGPVTDAIASETMTVLYTVDEPGVIEAELELSDGRILPMTVLSDRLTVLIPGDAPEGLGTVRALTRDDLANEQWWELPVPVTGTTPVEPFTPPVGVGRGVRPTLISSPPSVGRSRSTSKVIAHLTWRHVIQVQTLYRAPGFRSMPVIRRRVRVTNGATRTQAELRMTARAHLSSSDLVVKRAEGPRHEEELVLLGILA